MSCKNFIAGHNVMIHNYALQLNGSVYVWVAGKSESITEFMTWLDVTSVHFSGLFFFKQESHTEVKTLFCKCSAAHKTKLQLTRENNSKPWHVQLT